MNLSWIWVGVGVICFFVSSHFARGAEEKASSGKKMTFHLGLKKGVALKKFDETPLNYETDDLNPPLFGVDIFGEFLSHRVFRFFFNIDTAFIDFSSPFLYFDTGMGLHFRHFYIKAGPAFTMSMISSDPYKDSHTDTSSIGTIVDMGVNFFIIEGGLVLRTLNIAQTDMKSFEGEETSIDHDSDQITRVKAKVHLGPIKLYGAHTTYSLGSTAIASKDFSFRISPQTIKQYTLGVGFATGRWELWAKYNALMDDPKDEIEYLYQAPHYHPDYLLAKESGFVEVLWKF